MPVLLPRKMGPPTSTPLVARAALAAGDLPPAVADADPAGTNFTMYSTGLNGVRVLFDNASSNALYGTMALLCVIVVLVRLAQRGNAHLRHLFSLTTANDGQAYWQQDANAWWPWLKRHFLYAPLRNKRHNRELQLSAAVNVGTLPSRLHTVVLALFLLSNVAYMCMLDYANPTAPAVTAELRGRSGHLATLNMLALVLFAGRNNPLIRLLRISFDTFNLFHRWLGRVVVIESLIHTIAWAVNARLAHGADALWDLVAKEPFLQVGVTGTIAMVIILVQAPSTVRHAFYETFLVLHQLLAFVAVLAVYYHAKLGPLPQLPFTVLLLVLWGYDRGFRLGRLLYRNVSWRRGCTKALVEALPGEACRVTFQLARPWTPAPGAHVYAYLPTVSFWQSHPFSVAWSTAPPDELAQRRAQQQEAPATPSASEAAAARIRHAAQHQLPLAAADEKLAGSGPDLPANPAPFSPTAHTVSLIMSARTGMTRKLYEAAQRAPGQRLRLPGLLEGPYGALESLRSYGTVVLFAGGVGITHLLPHVRDLLSRAHPPHARTAACRRLLLVWTVRTADQLEWVRPYMNAILALPARREVLRIRIFITRPKTGREVQSASARVQMFPGRPKPDQIVAKEAADRVGAMTVGVCGPGALADDVRAAARRVVEQGKVDFWEEAFTW